MSTISNASFAGGLFKFEMLRNTYYGNHLFTIWRKGWKYATVAFRNSACILFCCSTGKKTHKYIIFHKKKWKTTTNKPIALYRAHGVLTRVHRLWKTFTWRTDIRKKTQKDILVNALAISLRQYCDYVCYISAPIYLNCKLRCKKLNCAATEITLRFYWAQSHDPYFEHASNTVRQLSVWL